MKKIYVSPLIEKDLSYYKDVIMTSGGGDNYFGEDGELPGIGDIGDIL